MSDGSFVIFHIIIQLSFSQSKLLPESHLRDGSEGIISREPSLPFSWTHTRSTWGVFEKKTNNAEAGR